MKELTIELRGILPLLMNNPQCVDPLNPLAVEMSKINALKPAEKKLESNIVKMRWLQFQASLYWDEEGKCPYIPATWLFAHVRDGARKQKKGKDVERGVHFSRMNFPLLYEPEYGSVAQIYADPGFVDVRVVGLGKGNSKVKVMRTRARFNKWGVLFSLFYDPKAIGEEDLRNAFEYGAEYIGLGDHRPIFGKYEIAKWSNGK
jgi:hypothetical protein